MPSSTPARPTARAATPRTVRIIGVPLDLGASRRGVDMGPSAMRIAQLVERLRALGHSVEDVGNLIVSQREQLANCGPESIPAIAAVCTELARATADAVRAGVTPLVLGGDHSLAMGSVAGVATALAERGGSTGRLGVIWLDAHGDINTPASSTSGNVHGMPVAHLVGWGDPRLARIAVPAPAVHPEHLVMVGLRDLDPPERRHIRELGIAAYTMREIDERGLMSVMADAIAIAGRGTDGIHVSCDPDWVDPLDAPGVGTPVRGGATFREAHLALELVADSGRLVSMDLVEINPVLDERNRTASLAVDLIVSAFGARIL
jgi:arginase